MTSTKHKLGEFIEQLDSRNTDGKYKIDDVRGISTSKEFITTKADMKGVSLSPYKIVNAGEFAFVSDTSRRGDKMSLAYNNSPSSYIVSSISCVFKVSDQSKLLPDYLYIYFNRPEFDRYARFNSWGSARETFAWEDMCDIEIDLPPIEIQKKYVDIYNAMLKNQESYDKGLDDLKTLCVAYIENLRRNNSTESIGKYIYKGEKNSNGHIKNVLGIGAGGFIKPQKTPNESLNNYKVIKKGAICYAPPLYNILTGAIHGYDFDNDAVCSPIYEVFYCNKDYLLPEYLVLWLKREEFKRYAEFHGSGVRGTFDYALMEEFKIPIPPLEVQRSISEIFKSYNARLLISDNLRNKIKSICPILIKGSLEEANK